MSGIKEITLYSYYYSSASWRIRAVLALKKIAYKYQDVKLLDGQQHSNDYASVNPMHQVPSLKVEFDDGNYHILTQSLSIIQYLETMYPTKPVYPQDPILRAKSQAIADTIAAGIQPFQNLETLTIYKEPLGGEITKPEERKVIAQFWLNRKMKSLDQLVEKTAGKYCVGDELTIADICLVPQMLNARRFELDTTKFPTLKAIDDRLQELECFKVSHPLACPDAPKNLSK